MKFVIVGGVAGGASAATRLRRLSEDAEIILFEKGEYISYANCGLPYYLGGTITDRDRLIVTKADLLRSRFDVDVRVESEVTAINRTAKTVTVHDRSKDTTYEESYDKLLLSPGANPKMFNLPGIDSEGIFTLRTLSDTFAIDDYIKTSKATRAVIVGGGFIGVEMAENLKERGLDVTLVEFMDQVLAFLDKEIAIPIHQNLRDSGIQLCLNTGVNSFERKDINANNPGSPSPLLVSLSNGAVIKADLVIMCTGVVPDSSIAVASGLTAGIGGCIQVDDQFRTSDQDIFAVGDAISVSSIVSGKEVLIPLAGPANKQGREAAEIMLTGKTDYHSGRSARCVQGSSVVKIFDQIAAATGFSEKQLVREGISYQKTYIHPSSHATYYPNSTNMSMKLLFAADGKILGAQAVGYDGVEKRIDVIATVLRLGGTVYDLEDLELCYAPPVSSAKDPVNMLGFTAANILKGDMKPVYAQNVDELVSSGAYFLDVSTKDEVAMGTISGAISIPLDELRSKISEVPTDKPVYVFCRVGLRGYVAARMLAQHGIDVYNLSGGYRTYNIIRQEEKAVKQDMEDLHNTSKLIPDSAIDSNIMARPGSAAVTQGKSAQDSTRTAEVKTIKLDACGLSCPGPIMKVAAGMKELLPGDVLRISATDPAFASDINVWTERTGNTLLSVNRDKGIFTVEIQKGVPEDSSPSGSSVSMSPVAPLANDKTMVIFSGDLDKAHAAFIIANGAASMGRKVTLFFTFWGLNILRKSTHVPVKKTLVEKMFGFMMPRGAKKLGLSRMNMAGMGTLMIKNIMKQKNVQSLEELIAAAMASGVRVLACQMSMDLMGIKQEELLDGVELAGVATFLGSAELSDTNLFI